MQISGNTIVITGGSTGIGREMAELFVENGNEVVVCGRRQDKLEAVAGERKHIHAFPCDVSKKADRDALFESVIQRFPRVNILINNAGIQRETDFRSGAGELFDGESEIDTNFTGSVHLAALFAPYFLKREQPSAIVNITSGLAFTPLKIVPVYCATKAAMHSFSMSLRSQLSGTNVQVFEVIPPLVRTELHRGPQARKQGARGILPERVAKETLRGIRKGRVEITIGQGRDLKIASRLAPHFFHKLLNKLVDTPDAKPRLTSGKSHTRSS